ncbi:MAG TPA: ATP-binding protein [Alloacidobacterium sp.]|nr:ATP-binding protein [Alloacidobacterium sp.]
MRTIPRAHRRKSLPQFTSFSSKFGHKNRIFSKKEEKNPTLTHDVRNVVAVLRLFCDLLAEPGVLAKGNEHFAGEFRAVASTSSALLEKLAALPAQQRRRPLRDDHIHNLAAAVQRLRGPLSALAGARINLEMECLYCAGRVRLSHESLTRILINLVRNAAEAMPDGGRIRITTQLSDGSSFLDTENTAQTIVLCVQDSGPGIPPDQLERVFDAGFSTKTKNSAWTPGTNRGLGLSIVRRLVQAAGGAVRAVSAPGGGTRFEVELPLIHFPQPNIGFAADFQEGANLEC